MSHSVKQQATYSEQKSRSVVAQSLSLSLSHLTAEPLADDPTQHVPPDHGPRNGRRRMAWAHSSVHHRCCAFPSTFSLTAVQQHIYCSVFLCHKQSSAARCVDDDGEKPRNKMGAADEYATRSQSCCAATGVPEVRGVPLVHPLRLLELCPPSAVGCAAATLPAVFVIRR